jgi:O-antigen/teichoic acid export membrane protein
VTATHGRAGRAKTGSSYSTGLLFSLASFAGIAAITLFTGVLSARLYGIAVVGQAALVLAPVVIVTLLSTVREQPSMVRELAKLTPRHPRATGITLAVFVFSFALTAVVTLIGVGLCYLAFRGPLHHPDLFAPAAVGLCGYLVIINTCWNIDGVFGAFRAARELFAVRLHQAVMYGLLLVAFNITTHSVWGMLFAFLGSWATALVHRLFLLRRVLRLRVSARDIRGGFDTLRTIVSFGLKMTPGFLATGLSEASGTWIIGATSSVSAVGAYSRAWNFATRLTELNWRITEMLLPTLVQHRHDGDIESFDRIVTESIRYAAFGMLLPAAVGGGAADALMRVFGEGFDAAAPALRLLLFVPLLQTLTAIQGAALVAHDRPWLTAVAQVLRFGVTAIAGIVLATLYGITGMAVAMAAGSLVCFVAYHVILHVRLRTATPTLFKRRQLGGFAAAYAGGFVVAHVIEAAVGGDLGLLAALGAGSAAYVAVAVAVGGTTVRDRARIRSVAGRLMKARIARAEMSGAA